MFGLDKNLKGDVRIENTAIKDDVYLHSDLDLETIAGKLNDIGIVASVENAPMQSLCNEAFWHMLRKCNGHVVFFHVPSIKYITETFIEKIRTVL